jgi:hypothetical protein
MTAPIRTPATEANINQQSKEDFYSADRTFRSFPVFQRHRPLERWHFR